MTRIVLIIWLTILLMKMVGWSTLGWAVTVLWPVYAVAGGIVLVLFALFLYFIISFIMEKFIRAT